MNMSLAEIAAVFLVAVLTALLWSYGLEIITNCVKFLLLGIFKIIKLILFREKKEAQEQKDLDPEPSKEKTS